MNYCLGSGVEIGNILLLYSDVSSTCKRITTNRR